LSPHHRPEAPEFSDQKMAITNPIKEVAKYIGWLAGSMAGIAAILYAIGYITTRTHLYLLGIDSFIQYAHEYYLMEGGNFFIFLAIYTVKVFLSYSRVYFIPCLVALAVVYPVYLLMRWIIVRLFPRLGRIAGLAPWLWRALALVLLAAFMFVFLIQDINKANKMGLRYRPMAFTEQGVA
jgi:hypothetical protein